MKELNIYLIEKLKINKSTKIDDVDPEFRELADVCNDICAKWYNNYTIRKSKSKLPGIDILLDRDLNIRDSDKFWARISAGIREHFGKNEFSMQGGTTIEHNTEVYCISVLKYALKIGR